MTHHWVTITSWIIAVAMGGILGVWAADLFHSRLAGIVVGGGTSALLAWLLIR